MLQSVCLLKKMTQQDVRQHELRCSTRCEKKIKNKSLSADLQQLTVNNQRMKKSKGCIFNMNHSRNVIQSNLFLLIFFLFIIYFHEKLPFNVNLVFVKHFQVHWQIMTEELLYTFGCTCKDTYSLHILLYMSCFKVFWKVKGYLACLCGLILQE